MPQVFLYEYITGGGLFSEAGSPAPSGSLLVEGAAMRRALTEDFALAGWRVVALRDARLAAFDGEAIEIASESEERRRFEETARAADATVVIAPEMGGALLARARWAEAAGARLISPTAELVAIAADKHACCERLQAAGITVPRGIEWTASQPLPLHFRYPAVLKPVDGAGSTGVQRVHGSHQPVACENNSRWRLEEFCPGIAASIAVLTGPSKFVVLPACRQRLADDDSFTYLGGECPLPPDLAARAKTLAERVVAAMPKARGFIGIDLVLGASASEDVVIEVNPRLTTSYVGLRRLARENLAAAMVETAEGRSFALSFLPVGLEFDSDGEVREFASPRPSESRV